MNIVTGKTGTPHITSQQDREINMGAFGSGSYVLPIGNKFAYEQTESNTIRIKDGVLCHQGTVANINNNEWEDLTISNGSQGLERYDLIVAHYEKETFSGNESMKLKVITGTASSSPEVPTYSEGVIRNGDTTSDMPLYRVHLTGVTIDKVEPVFSLVGGGLFSANEVLWTGSLAMTANDTLNLSNAVSAQKSGIVLGFAIQNTSNPEDYYGWQFFFVPKQAIIDNILSGHSFVLATTNFTVLGEKYIYIRDNVIFGTNDNTAKGTASSGIKFDNSRYYLKYVLGV